MKTMKRLILFLVLAFSFYGVQAQHTTNRRDLNDVPSIVSQVAVRSIPVGAVWYACDVDGFPLIFVSMSGRLDVVSDLQKDYVYKRKQDSYDPMIKIIFDTELKEYRVAETLQEHRMDVDGTNVIEKQFSEIIYYKRVKIE